MPAAAQLACTPLVAAISGPGEPGRGRGQPRGRPGRRPGHRARASPAGWSAWSGRPPGGRRRARWRPGAWRGSSRWPRRGAALPTAAVGWGTGAAAAGAAHALAVSALALAGAARCCAAARPGSACCGVLVRRRSLVRPPTPGLAARRAGCWSPATSARATRWSSTPGPHTGVVVDAGPDPRAGGRLPATASRSPRCRSLVLTHFHADHVDGLAGVARRPPGRRGRDDPAAGPARRASRSCDEAAPPGGLAPGRRAVRRDPHASAT